VKDVVAEMRLAHARTTQGNWVDMGNAISSDVEGHPTVAMTAMSPYAPKNLRECEANAEWIAYAHHRWPAMVDALEMLDAAYNALRSYQFHNSSPELAEEIADAMEPVRAALIGERVSPPHLKGGGDR
jgi:hypothetical protein